MTLKLVESADDTLKPICFVCKENKEAYLPDEIGEKRFQFFDVAHPVSGMVENICVDCGYKLMQDGIRAFTPTP